MLSELDQFVLSCWMRANANFHAPFESIYHSWPCQYWGGHAGNLTWYTLITHGFLPKNCALLVVLSETKR